MTTPKKENRNYKLDHKLKIRQDDPLYYVLENDIDLISNHIYLFGIEAYMYGGGADASAEPGVEYVMANRFIRNLNMCMRRAFQKRQQLGQFFVPTQSSTSPVDFETTQIVGLNGA